MYAHTETHAYIIHTYKCKKKRRKKMKNFNHVWKELWLVMLVGDRLSCHL